MSRELSKDELKYIIARILDCANEAAMEAKANREDQFAAGRSLAYYEVLDILKSELSIRDQDLMELGLNINLESKFL